VEKADNKKVSKSNHCSKESSENTTSRECESTTRRDFDNTTRIVEKGRMMRARTTQTNTIARRMKVMHGEKGGVTTIEDHEREE